MRRILLRAKASPDVVLALAMAATLAALVVPLPPWVLDAGLAANLAASVTLLVAALLAPSALKVASFPTLLLVTTLFRVGLNVSSTRIALAEGRAGDVIQAFGEFVVRGDYIVGAVVFLILTLVQFLVVAKGAERVAEVSARFTLDAMPGKQMSIDADLRAGAIDLTTARKRRRDLERESQMFGAMDGALKFVKGDVIAGLIIVLINLVGGICVGSLQNGLEVSEAAQTYALIAIGDGLVSQVCSLCVAVAAGLLVTRVAAEHEEGTLSREISAQLLAQPQPLGVAASLCGAMALLPGMPHLTFGAVAVGLGAAAWAARRKQKPGSEEGGAEGTDDKASPDSTASSASRGGGPARIRLDLSTDLTRIVPATGARVLVDELQLVRERVYRETGVRLPAVCVRMQVPGLPAGGYAVAIDDVPAGSGQLACDALYALTAAEELKVLAVDAQAVPAPWGGAIVCWVPENTRERLERARIPVRTPVGLMCDHLVHALKRHAQELLGVQEVQALLDALEPSAPALVKEVVRKVPVPLLTEVLRRLLHESVSIHHLRAVLEALVAPAAEGDATALVEACRQSLHRFLSHQYAPSGALLAYLVDPEVEDALRRKGSDGDGLDPQKASAIIESARKISEAGKAVVLASPDVRRGLRRLVEGAFPNLAVLTYGELDADLQVRPVGRLAF